MSTENLMEYRYIELTDNLEEIGKLLFYTDPYIYPDFFGNLDNATKVVSEAIRRGNYCFSKQNIFCAFYNNMPLAMICKNPGGKFKWNYQEWKNLFLELEIKIPDTFDIVAKRYFQPMNLEKLDGSIYILAVSVLPNWRHKRIGTELLNRFLMLHSGEKMILDTLEKNDAGIALYSRAGFFEIEHYMGYSALETRPSCIRMIKK